MNLCTLEVEVANKYGWEDIFAGKVIGAAMLKICETLSLGFIVPKHHEHQHFYATSEAGTGNPPPDASPVNDVRPMHWVELSKNGDAWVVCKEGYLASYVTYSIPGPLHFCLVPL